MRTDTRYTRVRAMLTDDAVPRLANGGIALCHQCQRAVYFAGGFMSALVKMLEWGVKSARPPGTCPQCGSSKLYYIKRYQHERCGGCGAEWTTRKVFSARKSDSWYDQIIKLRQEGHSPYRISKIVGAKDSKGVYEFVKRYEAFEHLKKANGPRRVRSVRSLLFAASRGPSEEGSPCLSQPPGFQRQHKSTSDRRLAQATRQNKQALTSAMQGNANE